MSYDSLPFHPKQEQMVDILRQKTQNEDPVFFRLMVAYYFSKVASMMRVNVKIADSQTLPVNMYAVNLAPSGSGKGHSMNVIEDNVINLFREKYLHDVFPAAAENNISRIAIRRSKKNDTSPEDEKASAMLEFEDLGELLFAFDSATSPALKQMRTKLLMASAGSMNLEIDEIGSNLLSNGEALNNYLELFDAGKIKPKLIKNTRENVRMEDLVGSTPTNMLLFGTPTKLLNGSKTEEEFYDFLETGYARRCFFGFSRSRKARGGQTAQDLYDIYNDANTSQFLLQMSAELAKLADISAFSRTMAMPKDVSLKLFDYRLWCQDQADQMPEHMEIKKAEMAHRYFKAAKLAATYAYIDGDLEVTEAHLDNALAMAEMSGKAFQQILTRDRPHAKLAQYIASHPAELTQADLNEDLPYYKGSKQNLEQMMSLAIAYGYKQGIYITRELIDGIEFFSGKQAQETDLEKVRIAMSQDITQGYITREVPFNKLHRMTQLPTTHWVTHALQDGYRKETNAIPGCNLIVLDVENSVSIDMAKSLLKDYTYHIYTTKRHTQQDHRYRIVLPLSHFVELDAPDFKEFMSNIFDWLPFSVDTATGQRARKWLSHKGNYWYNEGELINALHFVPNTKKAEEQRNRINAQSNLTNLERWYVNLAPEKGRNNQLMRYAYALIDQGISLQSLQNAVLALNNKFPEPLTESEVLSSVVVTASKEIATRSTK